MAKCRSRPITAPTLPAGAALERRGRESKRPGSTIRPNFGSNSSRCRVIRPSPNVPWTWRPTTSGANSAVPLWKLWGLAVDRVPPSDYTIGIDTVEVMRAKLAEMPGFPVYKIKLGVSADLDVLAAAAAEQRGDVSR